MITIKNLSRIYQTENVETIALKNINFSVKEGDFVAVMGPSGCGKTTLLNIIGMIDHADSGTYSLLGKDVFSLNEKQKTELRKKNIGFVFQNFNLIDELTVLENIELPLYYLGWKKAERKKRVDEVIERLKISHRKKLFPVQLSGGQQQRVAVARAVVAKPKIILADEPTGNLDSMHGEEVMNLLGELNKDGTTILMVTHSRRDASYSRRTVHLFDGQIINENLSKLV